MAPATRLTAPARPPGQDSLDTIRNHIANTLIGRTVDLLADTRTIAHGVVTGVLTEAGHPRLVVGGMEYDINQILTVTPTVLN